MNLKVWRGYHSSELLKELDLAWQGKQCLIVGSPGFKDNDFLKSLPEQIESAWLQQKDKAPSSFDDVPILGVLTSGTAASPRLVLYSKKNIESSLSAITKLFDESKINTVFCYPQPFHTFGLNLGYILSMVKGWKLVTPEGKYSRAAHAARVALREEKVLTLGTPVHLLDLKNYCVKEGVQMAPSYTAIVGGAAVTKKLWRMLRDELHIAEPSIGYGCTEAAPGLMHLPPGIEPGIDHCIGFPLEGVQVQLLNEQGLEFSGPNLCVAYEQEGRLHFPKSMVIRDHLVKISDGSYQFLGRYDLVINSGGLKISLDKVERWIFEKFGYDALAFGVKDARLGEDLGVMIHSPAKVVADTVSIDSSGPGSIDIAFLIAGISEVFGKKIAATNVMVVEHFPQNLNGKPDRKLAGEIIRQQIPVEVKFPMAVSLLEPWTPHRDEMIWIDEVLWAKEDSGACSIELKKDGLYMSHGQIRRSAMIEFVAQSFAYIRATQGLLGLGPAMSKPKRAFLVGAKDAQFNIKNEKSVSIGQRLVIQIANIRTMASFVLYQGQVLSQDNELLVSVAMKLFHE